MEKIKIEKKTKKYTKPTSLEYLYWWLQQRRKKRKAAAEEE